MSKSNVSAVTKYFPTTNEGFVNTLGSSITSGATNVPLTSVSGLVDGTVFVGIIEPGVLNKEQTFTGDVDIAGSRITNVKWTRGSNVAHTGGVTIVDYVAGTYMNMMNTGILKQHTQAGAHTGITTDTLAATGAVTAASVTATGTVTAANFVQSGGAGANGWSVGVPAPNTVTYNGNRSYTLVFNASDQTGTLSAGMRLRTTRTVAAPTQCTSLNGTTQYYSKTSPAGMTFTNNFVVSAWVKLSSYSGTAGIISRFNGTSGWQLRVESTGQVALYGFNGGSGNYSGIVTNQSIPLNKWVHIAAQLDMSTFTATTTTSYVMFDGVDISSAVGRAGTNPTALVQAGNLEVGSYNAGNFFPGKIAQAAVFSAKVTQATIQSYISQGLAGTETSLISAYSFNNSINDLNANANNLTANGSAVATNADSPFGGQADGTVSSTLDYAEVVSVAFSTNTTAVVRTTSVNTIPTSGGVSSVVYSSSAYPYGFPGISNQLASLYVGASQTTSGSTDLLGWTTAVTVPTGVTQLEVKINISGTAAVANTQFQVNVMEGSTVVKSFFGYSANATNAFTYVFAGVMGVTSGSHTYKININPTGSNFITYASTGGVLNEMSFSKT